MSCLKCKDEGWIHHQHPLKTLGVIMNSTPCQECNTDGSKKSLFESSVITITYDKAQNITTLPSTTITSTDVFQN